MPLDGLLQVLAFPAAVALVVVGVVVAAIVQHAAEAREHVEETMIDQSQPQPSAMTYEPTPAEVESLAKQFVYHPPKPGQGGKYERLRSNGHQLAWLILTSCPPSIERHQAIAALRESIMWANAAIAVNE